MIKKKTIPVKDGWGTLSPHEPFRNLISFAALLDMMRKDDLKALHERLCEQADDVTYSDADRAFLEACASRVATELKVDGVIVRRGLGEGGFGWRSGATPCSDCAADGSCSMNCGTSRTGVAA